MSWHVWNGQRSVCPATHPVSANDLRNIKYKVTEAGAPARWRLASDNYGTSPADIRYMLTGSVWDAVVQALWVKLSTGKQGLRCRCVGKWTRLN
jgi:hypothetical protein